MLGISNSYTCKQCNVTVCLSHRMPEYHKCASLKVSSKVSTTSSKSSYPSSSSSSTRNSGRNKAAAVDPSNTLRGTVERRKLAGTADWSCSACTSINASQFHYCQVCQTKRLANHPTDHAEYSDESNPVISSSNFSNNQQFEVTKI